MDTAVEKFTAVIMVTRPALRESSPLLKLVQALARSRHLGDVLLLWAGVGAPQVRIRKEDEQVREWTLTH